MSSTATTTTGSRPTSSSPTQSLRSVTGHESCTTSMPEPDEVPSETPCVLKCLLTVEEVAPKSRSETLQNMHSERRHRSCWLAHRTAPREHERFRHRRGSAPHRPVLG